MRVITVGLIIVLLSGLAALDTTMARARPTVSKQDRNSVAVALAGEFRVVFANLLWIKADEYHHEYIAHGGDWTKNQDALGLDRLVTKFDPHFEEAYAAGERLMVGLGKLAEARAFLEEGVTNNPNSMMLHDEYGTLLAAHLKEYDKSLFHLKRAYLLSKDDWDRRRLKRLIHTVEGLKKDSTNLKSKI